MTSFTLAGERLEVLKEVLVTARKSDGTAFTRYTAQTVRLIRPSERIRKGTSGEHLKVAR